ESGAWFATSFGTRGWVTFVSSIPLSHVAFIVFFVVILESLVRRYSLVYRRPLAVSFVIIAAGIVSGGALVAQTPLHEQMASYARTHQLPAPLALPYGPSARIARPDSLYEGVVISNEDGVLVIEQGDDVSVIKKKEDRVPVAVKSVKAAKMATTTQVAAVRPGDKHAQVASTTVAATRNTDSLQKKEDVSKDRKEEKEEKEEEREKAEEKNRADETRQKKQTRIVIDPGTRLPRGKKFEIGTKVLVEGDRMSTDTVKAFGVRDIDD
ncbi:hypothetical protein HYT05_01895, partial [Candidatus Kaiserbacteria bacterium]|nr:hypothetical protein [Candidatus Kaiserbacteria bacterium]